MIIKRPLASAILAPAVPLVMADFNTTSDTFATLVVSIFVLGFACGPLLLAPLSELYGRLPVYHVTNFLFILFTCLCALATSPAALLALRFLSGFAGVASITVGPGTIADLMPRERRGTALSLWAVGTILGPMCGPALGGWISGVVGWRWMFWVLGIMVGSILVIW
jgi:multidrug resistance protein